MGTVHGGWALTIIDSVTGCAAYSASPPGAAYATVETKANFTRPILADVLAVGEALAELNQPRDGAPPCAVTGKPSNDRAARGPVGISGSRARPCPS